MEIGQEEGKKGPSGEGVDKHDGGRSEAEERVRARPLSPSTKVPSGPRGSSLFAISELSSYMARAAAPAALYMLSTSCPAHSAVHKKRQYRRSASMAKISISNETRDDHEPHTLLCM